MKRIGVYWFTHDLRVNDNQLLHKAAQEVDELICVYCVPKVGAYLQRFSQQSQLSSARQHFLHQSVHDLALSLKRYDQTLLVIERSPITVLKHLIEAHHVTHLYCDQFAGYDEQQVCQHLAQDYPSVSVSQLPNNTLFDESQLPCQLHHLPSTFSQFRREVESLEIMLPCSRPVQLPPPEPVPLSSVHLSLSNTEHTLFKGGEQAAIAHCQHYFSTQAASCYKETRNALDEPLSSTKFSPWLALGCVSPKTIIAMLRHYEQQHGQNESTYWIQFELLWREYFYWYARCYQTKLFQFAGISKHRPLTSFYASRFRQWQQGHTPYPIVNACMKQLNATGYMSNRGRQLVASCLIHELQLDWRYGAAYFETQLIDYDVASNWGNWQYLAGVGADQRGSRQFNLDKQTEMYDPQQSFINRWQGNTTTTSIDHVDMADWPIMPKEKS
ncbi:DASH family cryptochrome [Vibrio sp. CAIM 722]|uniref:Cryptochrome DASH n=1 Tax=Vibrio eleionomae TaxID=2653505 RepID=A0A7X4RWE4_9VIBR|nr:DASH family cryptochrome [Vibrio eleionomae]